MSKKSKWQEFKELLDFSRWDSFWHWLKNVENLVDDPVDAFKEWLHCHKLPFGYQLNIAFMMKNRGKPYWPVVRRWGYYENCDPEDLSEIQRSDQNGGSDPI